MLRRKLKQYLHRASSGLCLLFLLCVLFVTWDGQTSTWTKNTQEDESLVRLLNTSKMWIKTLNESVLQHKEQQNRSNIEFQTTGIQERARSKIFRRNTSSTVILDLEKIEFLPNYRNPCWLEPLGNSNPYHNNRYGGKVSGYMSHLTPNWNRLYTQYTQEGRTERLRCLPHFLLGGFPKCGTTDLYDKLLLHPLIQGCLFKEPHYWTRWRFWTDTCFWHEFMCADGLKCLPHIYHCNGRVDCADGSDEANCGKPIDCSKYNGGCSHTCSMTSEGPVCSCPRGYQLKRDHKTCVGGVPLSDYIDLFDVTANYIQGVSEDRNVDGSVTEYHPVITGEASPATFWDNHRWRDEAANDGNPTEPSVLTANIITHLLPNVRMIVIIRNPTERLYSDLLYFKPYATPDYFHTLVQEGISWFNNCTQHKSMKTCVYEPMDPEKPPEGRYWHPVERIRIGMYSQYIKDWYDVVPRNQIKVVRLEDYSSQRLQTMNDIVNFLGLENPAGNHLEQWSSPSHKNSGAKKYERQGYMLPETQTLLNQFYKPFNEELASLLHDKGYLYS